VAPILLIFLGELIENNVELMNIQANY